MLDVRTPRQAGEPALGTLKLIVQQRTLNPEPWNALQVAGQSEHTHAADEPLRRVPLPPAKTIAIVMREHVMKIMVALAVSQQCHHWIITRGIFVGVGLGSPHVCQRVDKKCEV